MKVKRVALLSLVAMMASSMTVYALGPDGPAVSNRRLAAKWSELLASVRAPDHPARVSATGTVAFDARVGHAELVADGSGRTFLMLQVSGVAQASEERGPVDMALVLDRSGSMAGGRMQKALEAARGVVQRLRDGDVVSVVAFNTRANVVVPPTKLDVAARSSISSTLSRIAVGGDTCISCGIVAAMKLLARSGSVDRPRHMLVLSDGKANNGLREIADLRRLADRCHRQGVPMTTVGVGLNYDGRKLLVLAEAAQGRHHFVDSTRSMAKVFDAETRALHGTIATNIRAFVKLEPGVRLVRVLDRKFTRTASGVEVELGALSSREVKTVLMELDVDGAEPGARTVASVSLRFRDQVTKTSAAVSGTLGIHILPAGSQRGPLDPVVSARLERSLTSAALGKANSLIRRGEIGKARSLIDKRTKALRKASRRKPSCRPGDPLCANVDDDIQGQIKSTTRARRDIKKGKRRSTARCGCGPGDLMCSVRCSSRTNESDAFRMRH